jgi:creatinine amidohydrolase
MTTFFAFDELTWPEVADLPRSIPLVLPLGSEHARDDLARALGDPPHVGLLPPLPYGWPGSGLTVSERVLCSFLANLLDCLRADGFTRVAVLAPPGCDLGLGEEQIVLPTRAQPQAEGGIPVVGRVAIVPCGHTEQHGYHLPLSTDTLIIDAIARGVAAAIPDLAIALPTLPYGVSTHRASFAGTFNAGGRVFEDFCLAVIDALVARGCDQLYLLSGHGGNVSFLVNVVKYAGERHRRIFCATSWLYLSGPAGAAALAARRRSPVGGMGHACELETSLLLHLRPDLVRMERAVDDMDFVATPAYFMDWIEGGALIANPPWDDDTITGAYGAPSLATAENGRFWLAAAIAEKVAHVAEIREQHARREQRRRAGYGRWGTARSADV